MKEIKGRRIDEKVHVTSNASLRLDKYIAKHKDNTSKKNLVAEVVSQIAQPEAYERFYKRWEEILEKKCSVPPKGAKVKGRMAVGLGAESVLETSITLNHTYGVPYIPGSALKGLAAHYARNYLEEDWGKDNEAYKELFGSTEKSGCVDFYDALYIPDSGYDKQALWEDIITVHHPKYYGGEDDPPADWDSPTPIPFLSATGKYLIVLDGPEEWVTAAYEILAHALWQLGIGAKTSSGYGRILLDGYEESDDFPYLEKEKEPIPVLIPSKDWDWREGRVLGGKDYVRSIDDPNERYPIDKDQIIPNGYTLPGKKKPVHYAVITLENGDESVWVKQFSYEISD